MIQLTSLIESLNQLPCFSNISHVTPLDSGFSQPCYKVTTSEKSYFVKSEPFSSTLPILLNKLAAKHGLSPAIIYQDDHWLVTDFIEGKHLEEYSSPNLIEDIDHVNTERIHYAVNLMVRCHQLPLLNELRISNCSTNKLTKNNPLNCLDICNSLIEQANFIGEKVAKLEQFALLSHNNLQRVLTQVKESNPQKPLVGCHGDINFSNVLLSLNKVSWLLDFECACLAPAEFDMAMFIAINTLTDNEASQASKAYLCKTNQPVLNETLIQAYLPLCYLINALWYDNASHQHKNSKILKVKAKQQWQFIHSSLYK